MEEFRKYLLEGDCEAVQSLLAQEFKTINPINPERSARKLAGKYCVRVDYQHPRASYYHIENTLGDSYLKAGVYYYRKSKGEEVSLEEVLAMSREEIVEYRKSVASSLTRTMSAF